MVGTPCSGTRYIISIHTYARDLVSQKYTYEMLPSIRSTVDELTNCEDIFLNALIQDLTGVPPLMADTAKEYSCGRPCEREGGPKGLQFSPEHYQVS